MIENRILNELIQDLADPFLITALVLAVVHFGTPLAYYWYAKTQCFQAVNTSDSCPTTIHAYMLDIELGSIATRNDIRIVVLLAEHLMNVMRHEKLLESS